MTARKDKSKLQIKDNQRRGPISLDEKIFIRANVDKISNEEIAKHLSRNVKSVKAVIAEERLGKEYENRYAEEKTQNQIVVELKKKPFFKDLSLQFSDDELTYFCEYWVLTLKDFGGNILSYEDLELKSWLTFEILKSRIMRQQKLDMMQRDDIDEKLQQELRVPKDQRDIEAVQYYRGKLQSLEDDIKQHSRNYGELSKKSDDKKRGLVASREERTKNFDNAKIDFSQFLKMCQDYEVKKNIGYEMEVIRMAEENKRQDLYQYHEYADKTIDIPILNSKSIEEKDLSFG